MVTGNDTIAVVEQITQYEKEYLRYTERADTWIEYKKWEPAIQLYQEALSYYPDAFEPNYRLALASSYSCTFENLHCEEGTQYVLFLLEKFPNEAHKLSAIDSIFSKHSMEPTHLRN